MQIIEVTCKLPTTQPTAKTAEHPLPSHMGKTVPKRKHCYFDSCEY